MTPDQVKIIFQKHDVYIKSMKLVLLAPFITKIDFLCVEH